MYLFKFSQNLCNITLNLIISGYEIIDESPEIADNDVPAALPLRGDWGRLRGRKTHPYRRGYTEIEDGWKGKGKGDIQSIFQMTITALAFLAFGGYLICMIISAIKASNQQMMATTMTMTTMAPAFVAARRHRRATNNRHVNTTETMFNALQTLAEGYEKYNHQCQKITCH